VTYIVRRRLLASLVTSIAFALPASARADQTFDGATVDAATKAVDILQTHHELLAAQARLREPVLTGWLTTRWMPGRAILADGQRVASNVSRNQFGFIGGGGDLSRLAFFGGIGFDFVAITNPVLTKSPNFQNYPGGQAILFVGGAIVDVQWSAGIWTNGIGSLSADLYSNFMARGPDRDRQINYRPGTPYPPDPVTPPKGTFLAAYEDRTGASITAAYSQLSDGNNHLTQLRSDLQPLRGLPDILLHSLGLPAIGFQRIAQQNDAQSLLANPSVHPPSDAYTSITEIGADDVLGLGLRWRIGTKVSDGFEFRRGEIAYVEDLPIGPVRSMLVGARATGWKLADKTVASGDAFFLLALFKEGRFTSRMGLSYSYNSPDASTFIPIPYAHVFGFQIVGGDASAARPLIPYVRAAEKELADRKNTRGTP
jgi:hypothetical protein